MDQVKQYIPVAIGVAILYGVYKYAPGGAVVKAATLGAMGALVAKNLPYVNQYIS